MCTFVTLVAASGDLDRLGALLSARDRRGYARHAERVETPCLRAHLTPGECEYWLIHPPCDCGTFLGSEDPAGRAPERPLDAKAERWRRKGWSEEKIARALADAGAARDRAPRRGSNEDAAYWIDLMRAIGEGLGLPRLGLMHHFYRTAPGIEDFEAGRVAGGPVAGAAPVLARMPRGVIHDFVLR